MSYTEIISKYSPIICVIITAVLSLITLRRDKDLEKFKANLLKENEHHRVKLEKSKFIFQKEYEAAAQLSVLIQKITPSFNFPDMDYDAAIEEISKDLGNVNKLIKNYLLAHKVILDHKITRLIEDSEYHANQGKFKEGDYIKEAKQCYEKLIEAEDVLTKQWKGQSII